MSNRKMDKYSYKLDSSNELEKEYYIIDDNSFMNDFVYNYKETGGIEFFPNHKNLRKYYMKADDNDVIIPWEIYGDK